MNMKIIKNLGEIDITEYPIAEPELINGEVRFDDNGNIRSTGETLLWSIKAGEEKAVPAYVADYLLKVYGQTDISAKKQFLVEVEGKTEGEPERPVEVAKPEVSGQLICKHCGQTFKNGKGLGLHMSFKHLKELTQ